jgi:hypothetical protein
MMLIKVLALTVAGVLSPIGRSARFLPSLFLNVLSKQAGIVSGVVVLPTLLKNIASRLVIKMLFNALIQPSGRI